MYRSSILYPPPDLSKLKILFDIRVISTKLCLSWCQFNISKDRLLVRILSILIIVFSVTGCGGGGGPIVESANALRVFSDGSGVGKATASNGNKAYFISPEIISFVYLIQQDVSNTTDSDIDDLTLISSGAKYEIRAGFEDGIEIVGFFKTGTYGNSDASVIYLGDYFDQLTIASVSRLTGKLRGTYTYDGIYVVNDRLGYDFFEIGPSNITANFGNKTFNISAYSDNTQLNGSGFLDTSTGQISSTNLSFLRPGVSSSNATLIGAIGGSNGSGVSGVWHTNGSSPFYEGSFLAHQ